MRFSCEPETTYNREREMKRIPLLTSGAEIRSVPPLEKGTKGDFKR